MKMMNAIVARQPGGPDVLEIADVERPDPARGEILVRVHATALNRADLLQRQGKYPPPAGASEIIGLEMAGTVAALGQDSSRFNVGDRVFGLLGGGGYGEYATIPDGHAMPIPQGMSFEDAAAIPEVFLTAYQALDWIGRLASGETALIHAGASGVGTAAIQLVKLAGARVIVTASSGKHELCLGLGADAAIDYRSEDFVARVMEETDGHGADLIIDFIGAPYMAGNVASLALDGRIVLLAMMGGSRIESFDLRTIFRKRGTLAASTLRNRSDDYKRELTADFADYALHHFQDGTLHPVIDRVMDWDRVAEAHELMAANANAGKIVLRMLAGE